LQAQTKVLDPQDRGIVTRVIIFGSGTQQASICKPSAVQPIKETTKQTPSRQANASATSAAPLPNPQDPVIPPKSFVR
jgi:hypothetical protein